MLIFTLFAIPALAIIVLGLRDIFRAWLRTAPTFYDIKK